MRLEKLVAEVMPLHSEFIHAVHPRIFVPIQTRFKGNYPTPSQRSFVMGGFYEYVNWALYGGKLNDVRFDIDWENGDVGEESIKPDVISDGVIWEVKACCSGHSCNLMNRQLEGYRSLQYSSPEKRVLFSFYRHFLHGIKSKRTKNLLEADIMDELSKKTYFSIVLPFRVILQMQQRPVIDGRDGNPDVVMARLYEGGKEWPDCLCINSPTINRFLTDPEQNLRYLDLDPNDFEIERYRSPGNLSINRKRVNPFPIVRIIDKNHDQWVEQFMMAYEREMEQTWESEEELEDDDLPF